MLLAFEIATEILPKVAPTGAFGALSRVQLAPLSVDL